MIDKMRKLESSLSGSLQSLHPKTKKLSVDTNTKIGQLFVNGPLPTNFEERFVDGVTTAIGTDPTHFILTDVMPASQEGANVVRILFRAPPQVVDAAENQAADPNSKLASGPLRMYLVAKSDDKNDLKKDEVAGKESKLPRHELPKFMARSVESDTPPEEAESKPQTPVVESESQTPEVASEPQTPVSERGVDIDTAMPYGDLEPFGREDTAQELTEQSVKESDEMVDQLERAEVAEEKRAVFRALTRLRGAAITSFDGIARSQTGNIDEYNKVHKWRNTHPLHHLADEESDITKWAFPDNADF